MQKGWCDSKGTVEDIKVKIQMKQEGAFKRERAIAYSLAQKVCYSKRLKALALGSHFSIENTVIGCLLFCSGNQAWTQIPGQTSHFPPLRDMRLTRTAGAGAG